MIKNDSILIEDTLEKIKNTFESIEVGSASKLEKFIGNAQSNYNIAIKDLVYKPGVSPLELVNYKTLSRLHQFASNIQRDVRKEFKNKRTCSNFRISCAVFRCQTLTNTFIL